MNSIIRKSSIRAFHFYFFPFSTALAIEKIGFENFPHFPTGYYISALLATTGLAAGIQILEIPTAKIQISNGLPQHATGIR